MKISLGSYTLDSEVKMRSNITISGAGMDARVFKSTDKGNRWVSESSTEGLEVRDFRQNRDDQGNNTGIAANESLDSWLIGLEVLNTSGRDGSTGTTPALRISGNAKKGHIHNCWFERSSSVSIEAAISSEMCEIVNCTVKTEFTTLDPNSSIVFQSKRLTTAVFKASW